MKDNMRLNVLLLGSGGREHALAWKIAQSPLLGRLYIAPGNPGTADLGTNVPLKILQFRELGELVIKQDIHMVIVGPEEPLVKGIADYFNNTPELKDVIMIGPSQQGAALEGSKDFAKQFMIRHHIPTARYQTFNRETLADGKRFLKQLQPPYVLKADGLAAGKGVIITGNYTEACTVLEDMLAHQRFGEASAMVVIEEYLRGIELSVFVLTDGESYVVLPEAKDYKRVGEGDTGPNTGGMGSVSPVPFADQKFMKKVEDRIIRPTVEGLKKEKIDYQGFIFFGLMNVNGDPFVIEYNVRMGDPETEAVLPRLKSDLLELFVAAHHKELKNCKIEIEERAVACVMLVSEGYPGDYAKGKPVMGAEDALDSLVFQAGTMYHPETGHIVTSGGRVIAVSSFGRTLTEALKATYKSINLIHFDGMNYRKDIGFDLV